MLDIILNGGRFLWNVVLQDASIQRELLIDVKQVLSFVFGTWAERMTSMHDKSFLWVLANQSSQLYYQQSLGVRTCGIFLNYLI